jgi:undecaprenyl diphosphate synthase
MSLIEKIEQDRLPQHIAIIMDGNGRWAKLRGKDRSFGHREGVVSVRSILHAAVSLNLKYLTLYTFSTENWNRPSDEIQALMSLLVMAIQKETPDLMEKNVRLTIIGELSRLPADTAATLQHCIDQTASNTGLTVVLALSYSSRWEITEAVRAISAKVERKELTNEQITEAEIAQHLNTYPMPDPDLLIRTGGEQRISNFLLWQLAYTELCFSDKFWPEFREEELYTAILEYQKRERRFGKTSEQL